MKHVHAARHPGPITHSNTLGAALCPAKGPQQLAQHAGEVTCRHCRRMIAASLEGQHAQAAERFDRAVAAALPLSEDTLEQFCRDIARTEPETMNGIRAQQLIDTIDAWRASRRPRSRAEVARIFRHAARELSHRDRLKPRKTYRET